MPEHTDRDVDAARERDPAPAVTRALRILGLLAESAGVPQSLSDIARALGIAKSSTANLCQVLEDGAMIQRSQGGYALGRRTAELGGAFAMQFNQVREFFSVCAASPVLHGEVVQIAMLDGADALYLARHEGRPQRLGTPLGSRLPAALTATGRALLMRLDDGAVTELLHPHEPFPPITERSVRGVAALLPVLAAARARGYAVDDGGSYAGIVGVAVPLEPWSPADPPLALGVALPADEADDDRVARIGGALGEAAAALTNPLQGGALRAPERR